MARAAVYLRISQDREGSELGVDRQREDILKWCEDNGHTITRVYCDNDISASTRSDKPRPEYNALLKDAKGKRFDIIIAYTSGRLTRKPRELLAQIELAEKYGTKYAYLRSPSFDLNTADGRATALTVAAWDAAESERIGERVSSARKQQAKQGRNGGGIRAFAFCNGGREDAWCLLHRAPDCRAGIDPVPDEAEVIRACSHALVNNPPRKVGGKWQGVTLAALARDLRAGSVATVTGARWSPEVLRDVLLRPRNAGRMVHQGTTVAEYPDRAIVPGEVYDRVREILTDGSRATLPAVRAPRWLLSGIAECGVCDDGTTMQVTIGTGRQPRYTCKAASHLTRNAGHVDALVEAHVIEFLSKWDSADVAAPESGKIDAEALRTERKAINERKRTMARDAMKGDITREEWFAAREWADARLAEIDDVLSTVMVEDPIQAWLDADPEDAWQRATLEDRRQLVRRLMTVRILPTGRRGSGFDPASVAIEQRDA